MQTVQIVPGVAREVEILITSDNHSELEPMEHVDRMFDANGSETFDPTEATEIEAGGELRRLRSGDRISIIVQF